MEATFCISILFSPFAAKVEFHGFRPPPAAEVIRNQWNCLCVDGGMGSEKEGPSPSFEEPGPYAFVGRLEQYGLCSRLCCPVRLAVCFHRVLDVLVGELDV